MRKMLKHILMEAALSPEVPGASSAKPKPANEKVRMEDGREVEFAGKRKLLKDVEFPEGQTPVIVLDFPNGSSRRFQIPSELMLQSAGHGMSQKLGDETAGEEDVGDMVLAVDELWERLSKRNEDGSFAGEWNTKREGGGMTGTSVLMKALMELTGKTIDQVKAFLKDKTQADKLALRNSPKVKPIIDKLEAEKAAKASKVDTDALLGQLGALG